MDFFAAPTRSWFLGAFPAGPTPIQAAGWEAIDRGENALLVAPTGSGKTLAAFLYGIDAVLRLPADAEAGVRVVYVSPLKALAYDVERNLRAPLVGIRQEAERLGLPCRDVRVDVRTGDTPQRERQRQQRDPADILVTTPESLFLLLGSRAGENFRRAHTVIVDEVHALAPTKRGVHLALSLERLVERCAQEPQRIGLSATVRPADAVARFLAGARPATVVDKADRPRLSLSLSLPPVEAPSPGGGVRVEAEGASLLGENFKAPAVPDADKGHDPYDGLYRQVLEQIRAHRSTLVFTNSRGQCERMAQRLNELAEEELVFAHHGSVSQNRRRDIEEALKRGTVRGLVATSSLELGIDMGAVDLVILIDSPASVARGLQRVGRAGHQVDAVSEGVLLSKFRSDLLESAVVLHGMAEGAIESVQVPVRCLDVLAQQVVAMVCEGPRSFEQIEELVRRSYPYRELSRELLTGVLDMLTGRYPSDDMADLRPRLSWDRTRNQLQARRGTAMVSRLNAGTIPDRGLFHVHLGEGGPRVGELDEEMVFETRAGEVILLGTSSWRVLEITRDRVLVEPAPGEPGKLPFWRGESIGRPIELGCAIGALLREVEGLDEVSMRAHLQQYAPLDQRAATALAGYLEEQRSWCGCLPSDLRIVVERFRDEVGDWRICILSPFGGRVHAPWAMALQSSLSARRGFEVVTTHNDDGIVLTFADSEEPPEVDELIPDPEELEDLVADQLDGSALFGAAFRENAARALLMPKRNPKARSPLWAQRLKAKSLMAAVLQYADFPIVLETYRQCMRDVFDLPALQELLTAVRARQVRVEAVQTPSASPFARSLVFAHVATYLYEFDAPLAERRSQALTLDRNLLRDLLGDEELRELLDPELIDAIEAELQGLHSERRARDADELHDLLRRLGALPPEALAARCVEDPTPWLEQLRRQGRAAPLQVAGCARWIAAQDAGLYRDALGAVPPQGLPAEFTAPVDDALGQLVRRWARSRGPFTLAVLSADLGLGEATLRPVLSALEGDGTLVRDSMRSADEEWCDGEVLRRIKRQTLARMRREVAPVEGPVLARFLARWQGFDAERSDPTQRALAVIAQLEGCALPWSEWESTILPSRVPGLTHETLDLLSASGRVVWIGRGALGAGGDGRVALYRRESAALLHPSPTEDGDEALGPVQRAILRSLEEKGAEFGPTLRRKLGAVDQELEGIGLADFEQALWDLVWAGRVTNDTFGPLRYAGARSSRRCSARAAASGGRWSSVATDLCDPSVEPTRRAHARAAALLERYGVVSRSVAQSEELVGGFASVYGVLKAMEETGRARRGHFVDALDGAQFALPGAIDRLRELRDAEGPPRARVLAAVDPANPWGALLPWPETDSKASRPRRTAGARVVLVDGAPILWFSASGKSLLCFAGAAEHELFRVALRAAIEAPRRRAMVIERIDGVDPGDSPQRALLEELGFSISYRGWVLGEAAGA